MTDKTIRGSDAFAPLGRPVMVYDSECAFCRRWVAVWRELTAEEVEYLPALEAQARIPGLEPESLAVAVHLVEPGGRVVRGAEAVARSLAAGKRGRALRLYLRHPAFGRVAEAAYRMVALHRGAMGWLDGLLFGEEGGRMGHQARRWLGEAIAGGPDRA
ncbi:MAG: DUF393 domain-containing protein [Deltaproteobacteria bacterium]|nr:DUF393 domain-containing protein [Deltaproteobacteria bacterium]